MINDFNSGAVGWSDWNVLLDEQGGPNHVKAVLHQFTSASWKDHPRRLAPLLRFSRYKICSIMGARESRVRRAEVSYCLLLL